jgi:hypothetical protein
VATVVAGWEGYEPDIHSPVPGSLPWSSLIFLHIQHTGNIFSYSFILRRNSTFLRQSETVSNNSSGLHGLKI